MSIQGGGGPKGPRFPTRPTIPQRPKESGVEASTSARPHVADVFDEPTPRVFPSLTSLEARIDEPPLAERPSSLRSMVRVLEQTEARLTEEHRALHEEAQATRRVLIESGFASETVTDAKASLDELRTRMAKQRRRLSDVRRRLRLAHLEAGTVADPAHGRVKSQLDDVAAMPSGLDRRFATLSLASRARPRNVDGSRPLALRLPVPQVGDKRQLGDALALAAPEAAVSQHLATLLGWPGARPSEPAKDTLPGSLADIASFARVVTSSAS